MTIIDETNQILDKVQLPKGDEDWFILKDKNGEKITRTSHTQQTYMGQEITKEVFGKGKGKYAVASTQKSYDLMHSDEKFKKLMEEYWAHNRELLLKSGLLIPDPQVRDVGGELKYILETQMMASEGKLKPIKSDKAIEVKINKNDAIDTLVKAGVMKEPTHKVYRGGVYFEDGLSSLWSSWGAAGGCPGAVADWLSLRGDDGLAAFEKLPSPQEKID